MRMRRPRNGDSHEPLCEELNDADDEQRLHEHVQRLMAASKPRSILDLLRYEQPNDYSLWLRMSPSRAMESAKSCIADLGLLSVH
jgi:hypothetical protein